MSKFQGKKNVYGTVHALDETQSYPQFKGGAWTRRELELWTIWDSSLMSLEWASMPYIVSRTYCRNNMKVLISGLHDIKFKQCHHPGSGILCASLGKGWLSTEEFPRKVCLAKVLIPNTRTRKMIQKGLFWKRWRSQSSMISPTVTSNITYTLQRPSDIFGYADLQVQ